MNLTPAQNFQGRRVLLVDDEPENLKVLCKTLESEKLNIFMAHSGPEALDYVEEYRPDLILLDVVMPGMTGFEVCEKLKVNEKFRNIPIIFLTGRNHSKDIDLGFSLGCADYILKPFKVDEVSSRVRTHLFLSHSKFGKEFPLENDWTDIRDMRVLIVDDVPDNIEILIKTLSPDQLKFSVGLNGLAAIEIANKAQPDLIVLDVMMPEMNGFEACHELKTNDQTKDIPIIFLTALQEPGDIEKGFSLGCADYVSKPFREAEVRARIRSQLKLGKLMRQKRIWMEELAQAKQELEKQLLERNVRLARAQETAEQFRQSQMELITRVSHDIRTPLNAIMGFSDLLMRTGKDMNPEHRDSVDEISKAGQYLLALVNNTMELGKIESGSLEVDLKPVDISKVLLEQVLPVLEPMAKDLDIQIQNKIDPAHSIKIIADPVRLARILQNLGSNAIKYNRPGGKVVLECEALPQDIGALRIEDTGPGIPKDKWESIFQPYVRLATSGKNKEGSGIGLAIVRQLVESMNGTVSLSSEIDKGSCFTIHLPLAPE